MTETVSLSAIRTDGGTQPRAELSADVVADYAEAMKNGTTFPPVIVFYDGTDYWLADGFHRVEAAREFGVETVTTEVRQGTQRDAVLYSVGANASHGLRRTNADKRRAVERLLADKEWSRWSDREIARRCAVHHELVGKVRTELTGGTASDSTPRTYTTKHGTVSTMKPRREPAPRPDAEPEPSSVVEKVAEPAERWSMKIRRGRGMRRVPRDPKALGKFLVKELPRSDVELLFSTLSELLPPSIGSEKKPTPEVKAGPEADGADLIAYVKAHPGTRTSELIRKFKVSRNRAEHAIAAAARGAA